MTEHTRESGPTLYAAERQALILRAAQADGRVEVAAVASELDVTPETVRRDLTVLERRGRVRRVHGGAIPVERFDIEPTVAARTEANAQEKERIARAAVDLVPAEGTVIIDGGTTTARLAEFFPRDRELTVVTTSLPVANILAAFPTVSLHLVGGYLRGRTLTAVGDWTTGALAGIYADVAFLGTNGLSLKHGLSTPDQREAAAKRAMIASSKERVVLMDAEKYGQAHFSRFADLDEIDTVITDDALRPADARSIQQLGPQVVRA